MSSEYVRGGGRSLGVSQRWTEIARALDPRVLVPALLLCALGLATLLADRPEFVAGQARWMAVGIVLCVATVILPYRRMLALIYPAYGLVLLALVAVLLLGREVNGAQRWLQLGPLGFQPSEMAKVAVVAVLARYIRFRRDQRTVKGLLTPFLLTLMPLALIVKQPDLGTALMLFPVLFVMLWAAGARSKHLATVLMLGALSIPVLWTVALEPYQKRRVMTFVAPVVEDARDWAGAYLPRVVSVTALPLRAAGGAAGAAAAGADVDARAAAAKLAQDERDARYHRRRSMIAVAAGGFSGAGFRAGVMNRTDAVPESWTDFVFTVHAEERGFLGVLFLLGLEGLLLLGLATTAREVKEPAARLLAVGAMTLFGAQACQNLAMTVGMAPITGLPLPFLSYGGSSMLSSWILLGLALNARAHKPMVFTERDFD